MKRFLFTICFFIAVLTLHAGGPENAGHVAFSTNPLSLIVHARPVALDLRTGSVAHEFRFCSFGAHSTNTLYAVGMAYRDRQNKTLSMQFSRATEYGYFMKFLLGKKKGYLLDDDGSFISFYLGAGYTKASWKMSLHDFIASDKDGIGQFTFTDQPQISNNIYQLGYGLIFFPKRGFFMDTRIIFGIRNSRIKFYGKDPATGNTVSIDNNVFYSPEFNATDFQPGHATTYAMAHLRFGYSF